MGQMGHLFKKRKAVSFRGTAMLSLTVIVIPLFIAVIIFDSYTVFQEQASLRESRENTLRMYQIQWEETLEIVETFLSESIAMDSNFSAATFSDSLTNTHLAAYQLSEQCRTFLQAYDMVEAFFFYSRPYDYHRAHLFGFLRPRGYQPPVERGGDGLPFQQDGCHVDQGGSSPTGPCSSLYMYTVTR